MNMTHPDILKMERYGFIGKARKPQYLGECKNCGSVLTDEYECHTSKDGLFCSRECIDKYYEIEHVN